MLRHLTISNIALIDKLSLDFEEGFSALTGETGAGKSILIEAVGLALGERAYRESIRTGAQKGSVEALFTVKEGTPAAEYLLDQSLYDGEEVVLYRELYSSGKSVCRINGTLVSAAELKTVGDMLVDMHGQHAHQSLLNEKTHLGLLDAFANSDGDGLLTRMTAARKGALDARAAREKLQSSLKERARRLDVIAYELKEIDGASLEPGEEEQLELKKKQLQNFAAIEENLQAAYDALYEEQGALGKIADAKRCLAALGEYGEEYAAAARQTEEAYYSLEDVSYTLRDALNGLSFDPETLTEIESRLYQIEQLKRKYGADIEEILSYADGLRAEQAELLGGEDRMAELQRAEEEALAAFTADARALSQRRQTAALQLKEAIEANLKDMGMPFASFSAGFAPVEPEALSETGVDQVSFRFSANKGEPEKPLVRVASGGEISRVMLSFKAALSGADAIDTLIFDEIDTGITPWRRRCRSCPGPISSCASPTWPRSRPGRIGNTISISRPWARPPVLR